MLQPEENRMKSSLISGILIAFLFQAGVAQKKHLSLQLSSLVQTERDFAATSLREGIRASFMKFFADDGVSLAPKPHLYKESAKKTPPPPNPLARTLYWEPMLADVSSSDDLGYTMGPSSLKDPEDRAVPVRYGFYFSIWKRQKDGRWQVEVDVGTGSTIVVEKYFGKPFTPPSHAAFKPRWAIAGGKTASRELLALERKFSKEVSAGSIRSAYQKILDVRATAMREGLVPITGKDAILAYLVKGTALRFLEPMRADASAAGDMGYTYGAYRERQNANDPSGYYARLWRKEGRKKWVLAVEVAIPAQ
jgi:hypothetical protein